jgi:glycosyltransferase involved in cell wall biosynthesis
MIPLSIIIVAKNEEDVIGVCLQSIRHLSDDILVCDTGSTDNTINIALDNHAKVIHLEWEGYGQTKNKANEQAKYEWILQLDADEFIDNALRSELLRIDWKDKNHAYRIKRKRYFMGRIMRFGAWGNEKRIRLFPKVAARWSNDLVHEKLILEKVETKDMNGNIFDVTFKDPVRFSKKMEAYAILCSKKYYSHRVKGAQWKKWLSPIYTFLWNYFIRLGFLDGMPGLYHATMLASYTHKKYDELHHLIKNNTKFI